MEKKWNYVGNRRVATYTNLPYGEYIFKVKAANSDGIWNEKGISLKITMLPLWWQTWWFKTLLGLWLLSIAYCLYRARIYQLKRRQRVLEAKITERTKDLREKNEEIIHYNQQLHQKNLKIQMQSKDLHQQSEKFTTQRDSLKRINEELFNANQKITAHEKQLALKNQQINHSIRVASTIQETILPHKDKLDQILKDYFVINQPKDVVSGDFYWLSSFKAQDNHKELNILTVADCTGHGIPGALISLIGNTLLDKIVSTWKILEPSKILNALHQEINSYLKQNNNQNNYGMNMGILAWIKLNDGSYQIIFSGAKNALYFQKTGTEEIQVLQGERRAIGGLQNEEIPFTNQQINLPVGSMIYMGTDGYENQNNPKRKKLSRKKLIQILNDQKQLSLNTQKKNLEQALDKHMNGTLQRDDILFLGFKLGD